ncbi:MAG: hypothetical protein HYY96_15140 [Candidatus Tectomicrobia bacterium]|nr:hypothetical protein [Candidatus Tectomicrobia bacterium]
MEGEENWISKRVGDAQKAYPTVTDAVAIRMRELIRDELGKRQLRPTDLTELANLLLKDMAPVPPKVEADE